MALVFAVSIPGGTSRAAGFTVTRDMQEACADPDPKKANTACSAILDLGDIPVYARRVALDARATSLLELGDASRARADAEALVRLGREPEDVARANALLAQALALGGQYELALSAVNEALKLDPSDGDDLALRGDILDRLNRDGEAERDLSAVVALRRNQANPYLNRGRFYFYRLNYQRAEDDFEHAVANAPTSALTHYWRGMVRLRLGATDAAGADFDAAITLHKRFPAALVRRAKLYEAASDEQKAEDDFSLAAAGPLDDPDSSEARAWIEARRPKPVVIATAKPSQNPVPPHDEAAAADRAPRDVAPKVAPDGGASAWLGPKSQIRKSRRN